METLESKISRSIDQVHEIVKDYKRPIVYTGFGKDAMVMHHMLRTAGYDFDCMFHRDPFFPKKYRFANRVIEEWNLRCYDYPHCWVSLFTDYGVFEVSRHYKIGSQNLVLCARLVDPDDYDDSASYLCAYRDIVLKPAGSAQYVWDLAFNAVRTCERKPHSNMEESGLRWFFKQTPGSVDVCYPIKDFSDEDMVEYATRFNLPWHEERYEIVDGKFKDKADHTFNPDVRPACTNCLNAQKGDTVYCPRKKMFINSVAENYTQTTWPSDYPR